LYLLKDKFKQSVFIATYKQENAQFTQKHEERYMILSFEQAGLLAQETFARLIQIAYAHGHKLVTPLSGACFSKENIPAMAAELGEQKVHVLISISQST
jgi:hypothetical protein